MMAREAGAKVRFTVAANITAMKKDDLLKIPLYGWKFRAFDG